MHTCSLSYTNIEIIKQMRSMDRTDGYNVIVKETKLCTCIIIILDTKLNSYLFEVKTKILNIS